MTFPSKSPTAGSTLMITLFFCMAIGIVLASLLNLVSSRNRIVIRSLGWNQAIPVLEAGIEEALTHLHDDSSSPSANGWTAGVIAGQTVYTKQRNFTDGSYFYVTLYNATANNPVIYSQGYVLSPLNTNQYISRMVKVCTTNVSGWTYAIAATGTITMSGGGIVDGFDSRNGAYSTATNRNATGEIATTSTAANALNIGTGKVFGTATTGPGGTISLSGGAIGDVSWVTNHTGAEAGWTNNNMNASFPTNAPPGGGPYFAPTVSTAGGSNVTLVPSGTYEMSSFTSSDSTKPMFVSGNATVWVTGSFTVSGSGYVWIQPGASLKLIVGGSMTVSGGGVVNGTSLASNCSLVGLPGCTSITYSGSAAFVGTINAPQAALTVSGSAGAYGAAIVQSANLSGGASWHYDDALGTGNGIAMLSWREM